MVIYQFNDFALGHGKRLFGPTVPVVLVVPVVVARSLKHFRLDLYCEIKLKSFATEIKVKLIYFMAGILTGRVLREEFSLEPRTFMWEDSFQCPVHLC